jgi:hypothetical protein
VRLDGECYATSRDGLTWRKPVLNRVSFSGSRRNNLVTRRAHGPGFFFDARETDPSKRYKMFSRALVAGRSVMAVGFSGDGVRWRICACEEIAARGDTHNNAFWAPTLGKYVGITRQWRPSKKTGLVRQVARTVSDDFVHWSKARVIFEGLDDDLQIYSMPVCYHAGVYLGMATILRISTDRVWAELAWSADTVHWNRVDPGQPVIGNGPRRGDYDRGCVYPSAPVFGDDEIRIYYFGDRGQHTDWRRGGLCLATLRPDGFAGYEPADRRKPAAITTQPLRVDPAALRVSTDVRRGGRVSVVVRDARSNMVAESQPVARTGSDTPIRWLPAVRGANVWGPVRLEFRLHNATLYSFSVAEEK